MNTTNVTTLMGLAFDCGWQTNKQKVNGEKLTNIVLRSTCSGGNKQKPGHGEGRAWDRVAEKTCPMTGRLPRGRSGECGQRLRCGT